MDDGRTAKQPQELSWKSLWRRLRPDQKVEAISRLLDDVPTPPAYRALIHSFAKDTNMREQTLASWERQRLVEFLAQRAEMALAPPLWIWLFELHLKSNCKNSLNHLLAALNLNAGQELMIPQLTARLRPEAATAAVNLVLSNHPFDEIAVTVDVLRLTNEYWEPLGPAIDEGRAARGLVDEPPPVAKDLEGVLRDFTTLDRVLIEQVVATSSTSEAALDDDEIDDLVQTLIALNPRRKRSYFVMGYADVLIPDRELDFQRPEFDDERRGWYLAGALLGLARKHDTAGIESVLEGQDEIFRRAAATRGCGTAIAKALLPELVAAGRIGEASLLVNSQIEAGGPVLAGIVLGQAVTLLRRNAAADAMALLRPVWEVMADLPEGADARQQRFHRSLARRVAQCMQSQGDFVAAEQLLGQSCEAGSEEERAKLLSDRGLVAGRFRSVFELTLPDTADDRQIRINTLAAGEPLFTEALSLQPRCIASALFALGQLHYLRWRLDGESDTGKRDTAIGLLQGAATQMRLTDAASAFERSGLLGHTLFMLTVLLMHRMEATDINAAAEHWRLVDQAAGKLPEDDLRLLLECADMLSDARATVFAESVWSYRRSTSLALVLSPARLERSDSLRRDLFDMAEDSATPPDVQRKILTTLVPVLLKLGDKEHAESGLDALEGAGESDDGIHEVMQFLSQPSNYAPAWTEADALWALVRLARKTGNDEAAARYLQTLFYRVRDSDAEQAGQIVDLLGTWRIGGDLATRLQDALPTKVSENGQDENARLARGERLQVVFVGGNETQARYDEKLATGLAARYPGLQVTFRHTGWTSNWGQQLPGLVKECNQADAVVIMTMIRTMLGCRLREQLQRPWVACVARGEKGMERSILHAAHIALRQRTRPT